jgi:hypothetical protein
MPCGRQWDHKPLAARGAALPWAVRLSPRWTPVSEGGFPSYSFAVPFLIVDKLGDMLKAKSKRGKGKKGVPPVAPLFPDRTASRFRKVHRFKRKIGEYRERGCYHAAC